VLAGAFHFWAASFLQIKRMMMTRLRFACRCVVVWLIVTVTAAPGHAQTLPRWTAHTSLTALLAAEKTRISNRPLNSFQPLTDDEMFAAGNALTWLMAGSLDGLSALEALGYTAYTFNPPGQQYYLLYEPTGPGYRGLGLVVVNRAPVKNVIIHGKHIGTDTKSHITTRMFFEDLGAVALIWTGVLRCNSSTISTCTSTTVKNSICSGYGDRISDASRFHRNVMTSSTLAAVARNAVVLDVHSNSIEPRHVVLSTGGPDLASQPLNFFPNRVRDRLRSTTTVTAGSCDHPDDPAGAFNFCGRFVQQKICNGLTPAESCGPMLPPGTTGRYVQVELRDTIYDSTVNTRTVITAFRTELP
jgi:hypothetical protein